MENEHQSLNYFSMMHGLYLGFALILNTLVFYLLGIPFSEITGLLTYAIIISGNGFAMWTFAKLNTEEGLPYSRALGLGTLVSLFGAVIFSFFTFILYKYIEPGLIDKMLTNVEEKLIQQGMKDDSIEKMLGASRSMMSPGILAVSQLFSIALMGFLFSLILAIFFKKEPTNPFHEFEQEEEEYE
jgi:hypothetical protein